MRDVLIVEDELLVALDLEDILVRSGYDVLAIVSDLKDATRIDRAPRVALVDLNLRDGPTGNRIAQDLAQKYGTRIVFVTANPAQISEPPPTAIGYVQKPFRAETVLSALAAAMQSANADGETEFRAFG